MQGLAATSYMHGFPGADGGFSSVQIEADKSRDEVLRPYRSLDPSRLKLSGTAAWDPSPFLSDSLWMAYNEPESIRLQHIPDTDDVPDLSQRAIRSCRWFGKALDTKGLLRLEDDSFAEEAICMRFFNCYKDSEKDRMIGDRRARNSIEGAIPGASRALPSAPSLSVLELDPASQRLSINVSDRKDFYHQFKVSTQRARTNMCSPAVKCSDLEGTQALALWCMRKASKRTAYDRLRDGDRLGDEQHRISLLVPSHGADAKVRICFASIPQGDHLGVEFAVDSHRGFLKAHNQLSDEEELRSDRIFKGRDNLCGLVIDDFFTIGVTDLADESPWGNAAMASALKAYADSGLLGSPEKDVSDADHAKVIGAELDSSPEVRRLGLVTLAAPVEKRLALAFISLQLAKMKITSGQPPPVSYRRLGQCFAFPKTYDVLTCKGFSVLSAAMRSIRIDQRLPACPDLSPRNL